VVLLFLQVVIWVVIVDAVLSWVQGPQEMPRRLMRQLTEPLYAPIHAIVDPQKTGGLDLSPIILIIGLQLLIRVLGG
jgi:YggT family protein